MAEPLLLQILMLLLAGLSRALSLLATVILIQLHNLLLAATPPTVVIITTAPFLQVLTAKTPHNMTLRTIFVLKAGDYQPEANNELLDTPPLSPLYIAGTTTMARSTVLAPAVTGGLLLRAIAAISTTCATAVVA